MGDSDSSSVVIVGGGLAGLACAAQLSSDGVTCRVLESSDRVGGRVRTDVVDGFTLDHGFQVLLTAYPACRQWLDYDALRLRPFEPGALVRHGNGFSLLGDPWRRPAQAIRTAMSPVGSLADKLRIARLRFASQRGSLADVFERPHQPTIDRLRRDGFGEGIISEFFRPFLGGVFLDPDLQTSSRMMEFVFRMFAAGDIAIPSDGMAAIPRQLAERLPRGTIQFNQTVASIDGGRVIMTDGRVISADHVVIATESDAAARLVGDESLKTKWRTTTTIYFVADASPDKRRLLMLAGDQYRRDAKHRIGTVVVLSDVAPAYAPPGRSLISVGLAESAGDESIDGLDLIDNVTTQLRGWFGNVVDSWQHLRTYRVPYGLPQVDLESMPGVRRVGGVIVCGDYLRTPSIQGAMESGIAAASLIAPSISAFGPRKNYR